MKLQTIRDFWICHRHSITTIIQGTILVGVMCLVFFCITHCTTRCAEIINKKANVPIGTEVEFFGATGTIVSYNGLLGYRVKYRNNEGEIISTWLDEHEFKAK